MDVFESLIEKLEELEKPSEHKSYYYRVCDSLTIMICGMLSSLQNISDIYNWALLKKLSDSKKPQYIKYPLSFIHKIWYNTHIADDPKTGTFYKKTANLRGVEVCTSTKTIHK